jgi:hypothetical protein
MRYFAPIATPTTCDVCGVTLQPGDCNPAATPTIPVPEASGPAIRAERAAYAHAMNQPTYGRTAYAYGYLSITASTATSLDEVQAVARGLENAIVDGDKPR